MNWANQKEWLPSVHINAENVVCQSKDVIYTVCPMRKETVIYKNLQKGNMKYVKKANYRP